MPIQRWRGPAVLRIKSAVFAAIGAAVAITFFPRWLAIPVAALLAAWGLSMAVLGTCVVLDGTAGVLLLRMGIITRRVKIADVTAVLVDKAKVSIARAGGGEISLYAWRKSPVDSWLRVPAVASDIGHAIASAVAMAHDSATPEAGPRPGAGTSARSRTALGTALLGCVGLLGIAAALLVRVRWSSPVMTGFGAALALALGISGLFYVIFSLWLLLTRPVTRPRGDRASAA